MVTRLQQLGRIEIKTKDPTQEQRDRSIKINKVIGNIERTTLKTPQPHNSPIAINIKIKIKWIITNLVAGKIETFIRG